MRARLLLLLLVTVASGVVAGFVGKATAGKQRPAARTGAGASGLLQLMPATARSLNLDAAEPRTNVLGGARYLRQMLDRFQSTDLALAAYNAGPTLVQSTGGIPNADAAAYVTRVTGIWRAVTGCV